MVKATRDMASNIEPEQLKLLFKQAPQVFSVSTIVAGVTLAVLWEQVGQQGLIVWFVAISIVNIARTALSRAYKKQAGNPGENRSVTHYLHWFMTITGTSGAAWGLGAVWFMQQADMTHQMFMLIILAGVSAGAQASYSSSAITYRVFLIPCLIIPGIWLLMQDDNMQLGTGILFVFYVALMWVLNTRNYQLLMDSLQLGSKNMHLLEHLEAEVAERRLNEERLLGSEIALQQKTDQLQSLLRLAKALEQANSFDKIMLAVEQEIKQAFGFNHVWIYLISDDPNRWQLLRSDHDSNLGLEEKLPALSIKGDAMLEAIAAAQGPVVVEDAQTDPRTNKDIVNRLGNRTIINVPIVLADSRLGTLGTGTFGDEGLRVPDAAQLEHLSAMASHVALALDRVRLFADRLDMQAQLEHTQRLDSLGLMAGGIAHDFNNILTSIMGNAAMAEKKAGETPESIQMHLGQIVDSSQRAADLCNQMLAYSGKGHFVVEMVDLSRTLEEVAPFLEASVGKHVELIYQLDKTLPMVEVDIAQIQQVIMNLVINASEAITEKNGFVSIKTGVVHADEAYLEPCYGSQPRAGVYVFLEVLDNGCGMHSDTAEKVFDPFFTTKFTGRGLGMSAILGIVRGHHGAIFLDSEMGEGTTFRILFPALEACPVTEIADTANEPVAHLSVEAATTGQILVIDDELSVRELAENILADDGFAVLHASDGQIGVDVYQQHQHEISLVLLDLTMPRMGGTECYHQLRRINPDVKVILFSGYSEDEALGHFEGFSLSGFISKPFMPKTLSDKVFAVLSQ